MNVLENIIRSLDKEEIRYYKLFKKNTHKSNKKKEVELFDIIRQKKINHNEEDICQILNTVNRNSFYQLKNKLTKNINKSLIIQHIDKDKEAAIYSLLFLSKIYKRKGELQISFNYLKKAEYKALQIENFELLSLIYTEIIKLSYNLISIDLEKYLKLMKNNKKKLDLAHDIDLALASVMYKIKTNQNFSFVKKNILIQTLDNLMLDKKIVKIPSFQLRAFKLISRILLQRNDFNELENYLKVTYKQFQKDKIFNQSNHEQKLMLLSYLTNSLYKNKKYTESLMIAEELRECMSEYNNMLKDNYLFYYYNALVINYSKIDKDRALDILSEAKRNKKIQQLPTFSTFIYLNMGLIYYDKKDYKRSVKQLSRLILQYDFDNLDPNLQLKIAVAELIIRHKLNQTDLIEEKIKIIKRRYRKILRKNERDYSILLIINKLIYSNNVLTSKDIQSDILQFNDSQKNVNAENTDIINYDDWLREFQNLTIRI